MTSWTASGFTTATGMGRGWAGSLDSDKPKKPSLAKGRKIPLAISDEQILEIRRLHEFQGKNNNQIREMFPELNMTYNRCYTILSYQTRSKLIPKQP